MSPVEPSLRQHLVRNISHAERLACMDTLSKLVDESTYGREMTTRLCAKHLMELLGDSHDKTIEMEQVPPPLAQLGDANGTFGR